VGISQEAAQANPGKPMKLLHGKILKQKYEISSSMANTLALENCKATFKQSKRTPADSDPIHCFMPIPESTP
jgi:hypothetical protein